MENIINSTSKSDYSNIELQIKKDQGFLKEGLSPNFLMELNMLVKLAMMIPKDKKEQGVTEEQLKLELLKLFLKQKQFKGSERIMNNNQYLALFDKKTEEVGKIVTIDVMAKTFDYFTYDDKINNRPLQTKSWSEVLVFDYNSVQMDVIFESYKRGQQAQLSFLELYAFLSDKEFRSRTTMKKDFAISKGFGELMANAAEHPMMQKVILERNIPKEEVVREKRKLQKLDTKSLEVIEQYNSVREANELTGISASTISNVTCQGPKAAKYLEAGGFKWQWSNDPNTKYFKIRINLGAGLPEDFEMLEREENERDSA